MRGRHRILLGMAAGVGKTYRMLQEGRQANEEGLDVVIGYLEPHDRPDTTALAAVIFNALIIVALIPLALRGVAFRAAPASDLLRRNLLIYGLGGIVVPFVGIKAVDLILTALNIA